MYDSATRKRALDLVAQGHSFTTVSSRTGVSRSAIRSWQALPGPMRQRAECPRCTPVARPPGDAPAYAYLLGLYLGDGCISRLGRTYFLRVACSDAWPGLVALCEAAMAAVRPDNSVFRVQQQGCVMVTSCSNHWPCLFPQHGPGKKHQRRIALEPWQQEIVDAHPWAFLRGLFHSDGCRITNWATRMVAGQRKRYEYPRYFFTNKSADILRLCGEALDRVGVEWRAAPRGSGAYNLSVARRASVALMDEHVGPKH